MNPNSARHFPIVLAVISLLLLPHVSAAPGPKGLESLIFHGRCQQNYYFQATVLANRKVTMLTRAPQELEVVETAQGKKFHHGRFAVERINLLEKRPPTRVLDTFAVTVSDSATKRSFVLNQGTFMKWPEYYAALSWSKSGDIFLVREGSLFPSPTGSKQFRVALINEQTVIVTQADIPMLRFKIPRLP